MKILAKHSHIIFGVGFNFNKDCAMSYALRFYGIGEFNFLESNWQPWTICS